MTDSKRFYLLMVILFALLLLGCEKPVLKPLAGRVETFLPFAPEICDTIHLERATTYQPTEAQCDSDPLTTADGSKINPNNYQNWVALSRDLLSRWGGQFNYGDTLDIYSKEHPNLNGEWVVHDCLNARYKMSIDFLMHPKDNYPKLGIGTDVKIIWCP